MDAKQFNINGTSVLLKDEQARNRIAAVEGKLPSDASSSNKLITKTVDDLVNYYLKSETYTKSEVEALIGAIQQFHYEVYASTSAVTNPSSNVLYLIGPSGTGTDKYEEYVYDATKQSPWIKIGDTSIDLSDYATISAMNTALAEKQDVIADLVTIRANATSAYQKPSGGIPKSDLDQGVKDSLDLADTALQSSPVGQVSPSVDPYEYATRAELEELDQELNGATIELGYFSQSGSATADQIVGLPIENDGVINTIYTNTAQGTARIQIFTAGFASVRYSQEIAVAAGDNNLVVDIPVYAGEYIAIDSVAVNFANVSSFEQIFWYNYGGATGWALRSDHIRFSFGYILNIASIIEPITEDLQAIKGCLFPSPINVGIFNNQNSWYSAQAPTLPIPKYGTITSFFIRVQSDVSANVTIYNSDFSVAKTIAKSLTAGANSVALGEEVAAGQFISVSGASVDYSNNSSFEQIFWYDYGGNVGWALRSDHVCFAFGFTLTLDNSVDDLDRRVTLLESSASDEVQYIVATRNASNYNSIREIVEGITDASPSKRYIIIVPVGRWFECDLKGKAYVTIQGEDARRTILYCDGASDKLTPSDYSFPDYASTALSSINVNYKHCINVQRDIDVRGLTIEVNDCKYCAHIDNGSFKEAHFTDVYFKETNANIIYTVGIGSHAGQEIVFERCDFKAYDTHTICAYAHNWNNLTAINTIIFKDCQFNKNFFRYDELGSDYSTFLYLLNCYSSAATPQLVFQTVTTGGHSHWINPETGEPITDMTQLPYCTHIDVCGSNVASIYQDGTRPDIADYIIGKIGVI